MRIKIVSDSSSNVLTMEGANYTTVPMKVVAAKEYVDTTALCSFYAEAGGLMIGFEGAFNAANDNSKF